jgi:hypothetical protein
MGFKYLIKVTNTELKKKIMEKIVRNEWTQEVGQEIH